MAMAQVAAVAVLGRAPALGQVKRRLAMSVGEERALTVYRWLLERTLSVTAASGLPVWFFATDDEHQEVRALAQQYGCLVHRQSDGDLGERMSRALEQVHSCHRQVILVGTDCPVLVSADLWQLAGAVSTGGMALMAAEDGGYVALASGHQQRWQSAVPLSGVAWGTESALSDTVESLRRYDERVTICGCKWDLDTAADLERARSAGICPAQLGQ